jgi:phosphatidylinositol glycan class P protein
VAVPAFLMVAVALSLLAYVGSNFLATPTPTSFNTIFGSFSFFSFFLTNTL